MSILTTKAETLSSFRYANLIGNSGQRFDQKIMLRKKRPALGHSDQNLLLSGSCFRVRIMKNRNHGNGRAEEVC